MDLMVDPLSLATINILIDTSVALVGVLFAKYNSSDDYNYALTSPHLLGGVRPSQTATNRLNCGVCIAG